MCTILNWIFEKQDTKIELDTSGSGLGLITGFREHGKELSGSMKAGNRLWRCMDDSTKKRDASTSSLARQLDKVPILLQRLTSAQQYGHLLPF
jgi:hypothetical protein